MIESKDIPYSDVHFDGTMSIELPKDVKELPEIYNQLTDEVTWRLSISGNKSLTEVTGFDSLTRVGWGLLIGNNKSLTSVTGFARLTMVGGSLSIQNNPKLVTMSIPGNLVKSVNYSPYRGIRYDNRYDNDLVFNSPEEFINSPVIINDLVSKLNPGYHSTRVIQQIMDNLEEWGTEKTKDKVYSHLVSFIIDDTNKHLFTQEILNKYHPDTIKNNNKIILEIFKK